MAPGPALGAWGVFVLRPSQGPALPPGSADSLCPVGLLLLSCLGLSLCLRLSLCLSPSDRCPELDTSMVSRARGQCVLCLPAVPTLPVLSWWVSEAVFKGWWLVGLFGGARASSRGRKPHFPAHFRDVSLVLPLSPVYRGKINLMGKLPFEPVTALSSHSESVALTYPSSVRPRAHPTGSCCVYVHRTPVAQPWGALPSGVPRREWALCVSTRAAAVRVGVERPCLGGGCGTGKPRLASGVAFAPRGSKSQLFEGRSRRHVWGLSWHARGLLSR